MYKGHSCYGMYHLQWNMCMYLVNNSTALNHTFSTNQNHVYFLHYVSIDILINTFLIKWTCKIVTSFFLTFQFRLLEIRRDGFLHSMKYSHSSYPTAESSMTMDGIPRPVSSRLMSYLLDNIRNKRDRPPNIQSLA